MTRLAGEPAKADGVGGSELDRLAGVDLDQIRLAGQSRSQRRTVRVEGDASARDASGLDQGAKAVRRRAGGQRSGEGEPAPRRCTITYRSLELPPLGPRHGGRGLVELGQSAAVAGDRDADP